MHSDLCIGVFGAHTATDHRALEHRKREQLHVVHGLTTEIGETPPITPCDLVTFRVPELEVHIVKAQKRVNIAPSAEPQQHHKSKSIF